MLTLLGEAAQKHSAAAEILVDVNTGMDRTGVPVNELSDFCRQCMQIPGITLRGLHCYDGHRTEHSLEERSIHVTQMHQQLRHLLKHLQKEQTHCTILILGGSPSFPCHTDFPNAFFSPGTVFVHDYGYAEKYPDLPFLPAASILTRVVSTPGSGIFTIDLGYKGISADPAGSRGLLLGISNCEELFQSEEHWTFRMKAGYEKDCPTPGTELFVIPTHICPTTALYSEVLTVEDQRITGSWEVSARNRTLTY